MDLTQLANLGEFIGGIAVLATLVYLAARVKQGNRLVEIQVQQETAKMSSEIASQMNLEDVEIFLKGMKDWTQHSPVEQTLALE
jgi:hypothetical protein